MYSTVALVPPPRPPPPPPPLLPSPHPALVDVRRTCSTSRCALCSSSQPVLPCIAHRHSERPGFVLLSLRGRGQSAGSARSASVSTLVASTSSCRRCRWCAVEREIRGRHFGRSPARSSPSVGVEEVGQPGSLSLPLSTHPCLLVVATLDLCIPLDLLAEAQRASAALLALLARLPPSSSLIELLVLLQLHHLQTTCASCSRALQQRLGS